MTVCRLRLGRFGPRSHVSSAKALFEMASGLLAAAQVWYSQPDFRGGQPRTRRLTMVTTQTEEH